MKARWSNKLPNNLPQLQNLIKRDQSSYHDEFRQQYTYYQSKMAAFKLTPTQDNSDLEDLVMFIAQVSHCYPEDVKDFAQELMDILKQFSTQLNPDVRLTFCRALILLRNKGLLQAMDLLPLFFELFRCQDKTLRTYLRTHIVTDIKNINAKHKDMKLNSKLQAFMYTMLTDSSTVAAKMSLDVMIALYRKNIWHDAKTVNIVAGACFSKVTKIMATALKFFLGTDDNGEEEQASDSEEEEELPNLKQIGMANKVNKKSRKRKRMMETVKRKVKKVKQGDKAPSFNFSALHLIHDPQSMAEKLLHKLQHLNERFEVKLMMLDLVSRLIGVHELIVLNFYPTVQRFLMPHQREVTKILQFAAQACHELIPPDSLEPVIMTIANNFITERNSVEVMTVGLNAVREICARAPLAMNQDLLHDIVQYKSYRDKNVSSAARSIMQLFRVINPDMLHRKFKAKPTMEQQALRVAKYGELKAAEFVPGAEVLGEEDENEEEGKVVDEVDDSDSDGSWEDVSQSEDEAPPPAEGEEEEEKTLTPEERAQRAALISATRILSQADFQKVKAEQLRKKVQAATPKRFLKKKGGNNNAPSAEEQAKNLDNVPLLEAKKELVSLSDIERLTKRLKDDKAARIQSMHASREEGVKFGHVQKKSEHASKTNKEKLKTKAYNMIKHKAHRKIKRSFRDKQIALRDALIKFKRNK